MILVGNKIDLQGQRKIKVEEGELLASQLNIPYVETSAKFDTMVDKSFQTIATEIMIKDIQKSRENTRSPVITASKKEVVTEVDIKEFSS
jgi:GTPase SAR1 family protein